MTANTELARRRMRVGLLEQAAHIVALADPAELLSSLDHAEAVGPLLDPTLYRDAAPGVADVKRLARAALPLAELFAKVRTEVEQALGPAAATSPRFAAAAVPARETGGRQ